MTVKMQQEEFIKKIRDGERDFKGITLYAPGVEPGKGHQEFQYPREISKAFDLVLDDSDLRCIGFEGVSFLGPSAERTLWGPLHLCEFATASGKRTALSYSKFSEVNGVHFDYADAIRATFPEDTTNTIFVECDLRNSNIENAGDTAMREGYNPRIVIYHSVVTPAQARVLERKKFFLDELYEAQA